MKAIKTKFPLYIAILSTISFCCKKNPPPELIDNTSNYNSTLTFKFTPKVNNVAINWNNWCVTNANDTVRFDKIKYILSGFVLEKQDGTLFSIPKSSAFISLKDDNNSFTFADIPKGSYKSLRFMVGVDSATNHGNPQQYDATHPLNPAVNDMFWDWSGGYIFNIVEGYFKKNGANSGFSFHVATDANVRNYSFIHNFEITKNSTFNLDVNIEKYFSNTHNYSLITDGAFSHSGHADMAMVKFLENSSGVLTINSFE